MLMDLQISHIGTVDRGIHVDVQVLHRFGHLDTLLCGT